MEPSISLPDHVPVMPLPGALLFPNALLPLHIFEPRYQQMLEYALREHRMFSVALIKPLRSQWKTPEDVKGAHPKASILKSGRVVFNIKANDYRLIALVQYAAGVLMIRFFGSHEEYDKVDAETV